MYGPGQIAPDSEGGGQGLYGVYTTDGTFSLITQVMPDLYEDTSAVACLWDVIHHFALGGWHKYNSVLLYVAVLPVCPDDGSLG
jgi:hypothetical protein